MSINMSQELRDMIQDLEKRYNTKIVDISFIGYRDTKIKWERTSSTIKFFISDYLEGIPDELLAEVLNILLARSLNDESIESSAELNDFFTTSVRLNKKKLYLSRIKGVYKPSKNKHIKIKKIVKELKENKLISEDYEFDVMM